MKKGLIFFIAILCTWNAVSAANDPVELAAPKTNTVKTVSDSDLKSGPTKVEKASATETNNIASKKATLKKISHRTKPKKIVVDYNKVSKLIEYNSFEDANKILSDAIKRNPKDIKAQSLWVILLAKQDKLDSSQKELDSLIKKYPNNSNLHYAQGLIYYQRTASSNMRYRNDSTQLINNAIVEFKKAIDLDKSNAPAYNAAGVIAVSQNKPIDAKNYFKKAIVADKTYSAAIDNLGTMDFAAGKFNDAEKKFKQALVYNSQNSTAIYHLAQIAMQKQDYANALSYLNTALSLNSASPAIYNLMGRAYVEQGNDAAAIIAFKKSVALKPEFALSYLDLADVYEKRGDSEFAIEQLKTALSLEPDFYDAQLKLADISLINGKYKQSADAYSALVGVDGYNESALKGLASAYFGLSQASSNKSLLGSNSDLFKAMDYINKAISANNDDLELHLAKLKLSKITNQPVLSNDSLQQVVSMPNVCLTNTVIKGEAYLSLNDYKNAENTFDSAISLSKNTQDDLYLSEIFLYHKQYDCAIKTLQKILKNDVNNKEALSELDYISKSKKYADNYYNSALSFIKTNNSTVATEYLTRSIAINPYNSKAHLLLAKLNEKQKNYQDALVNYKTYLGLEPNSADAKSIEKKIQGLENRL